MRRIVGVIFASAVALSASAPVAAASEAQISPVVCALFTGGTWTVEPGTEIVLWEGWFSAKRGQMQAFLNGSTWLLTVDGVSVDVTPYYSGTEKQMRRATLAIWNYPAGTLDSGETMVVTLDLVLRHPNFDGFVHFPRGSAYNFYFGTTGPATCTITAE